MIISTQMHQYSPYESLQEETKAKNNQEQNVPSKIEFEKKDKTRVGELTPDEKLVVSKLQARDTEVKAHEAAHISASGGLAIGGASYTYQKGPDGRQYAIGGEVSIDTSTGATPQETIARAQKIRSAATAPANPSGQDLQVAASAAIMEQKARAQIGEEKSDENKELAQKYVQDETKEGSIDISA